VSHVSRALRWALTVHRGHMPEIKVARPNTAKGIWAMSDCTDPLYDSSGGAPDRPRGNGEAGRLAKMGYGHCEESNLKGGDGRWRIASLRLARLRNDRLSG
jgi:hypothetical protein